jgi:hypothetical protein
VIDDAETMSRFTFLTFGRDVISSQLTSAGESIADEKREPHKMASNEVTEIHLKDYAEYPYDVENVRFPDSTIEDLRREPINPNRSFPAFSISIR